MRRRVRDLTGIVKIHVSRNLDVGYFPFSCYSFNQKKTAIPDNRNQVFFSYNELPTSDAGWSVPANVFSNVHILLYHVLRNFDLCNMVLKFWNHKCSLIKLVHVDSIEEMNLLQLFTAFRQLLVIMVKL
jgi:hypothetical protein